MLVGGVAWAVTSGIAIPRGGVSGPEGLGKVMSNCNMLTGANNTYKHDIPN